MNPDKPANPSVRHETSDANLPGIVLFVIILLVSGVIIYGAVWAMYRDFEKEQATTGPQEFPIAADAMRRLPPEPRLQTDPRGDLLKMREDEDRILHSYGWVDRNGGIVRIPIERAMELSLQRGFKSRPAPETPR